jgi:hypothetical protein
MKELSICQSSLCPDPVSFPVLSQIKPQAPLLVCPSVNSFKFQTCDHTPPGTQTLVVSHKVLGESMSNITQTLVGIVYSQDYDGI